MGQKVSMSACGTGKCSAAGSPWQGLHRLQASSPDTPFVVLYQEPSAACRVNFKSWRNMCKYAIAADISLQWQFECEGSISSDSSLFCHLCLWSACVINSAFCRVTSLISFKISSRSVFNTLSLLMEKGSLEAKCWGRAGSLPVLQAEPGHSLLLCMSHRPARPVLPLWSLLFHSVSFWVLNYPEILHRNSCASSGKPAVNQAGVLHPSLSPRMTFCPAEGLHHYHPPCRLSFGLGTFQSISKVGLHPLTVVFCSKPGLSAPSLLHLYRNRAEAIKVPQMDASPSINL